MSSLTSPSTSLKLLKWQTPCTPPRQRNWKRINCFPPTLHRMKLKTQILSDILDFCLRKKSRDYREVIIFKKLRFQNVLTPHENEKPAFSNSSGSKSVFEKSRFRDGYLVDGKSNRRNKASFSIYFGVVFCLWILFSLFCWIFCCCIFIDVVEHDVYARRQNGKGYLWFSILFL